jgi:hypothetical protein
MNYVTADMNIVTLLISMFDGIYISEWLIYDCEIFSFLLLVQADTEALTPGVLLNAHLGRGLGGF